jgi:hypothetical protein
MSGGARMLTCRIGGVVTTSAAGRGEDRMADGAAMAALAARQALRHFTGSMPSPQQSSGGADMFMDSHGVPADCAHTLAVGPTARENASSAARRKRAFTGRAG